MRLALCILALAIGPALGHHVAAGDDAAGVRLQEVRCFLGRPTP